MESARVKRGIKLFLGLTALYLAVFFVAKRPSALEVLDILPAALLCAVIQIIVAITIFWPVFRRIQAEDKMLSELRRKINNEEI